MGPLKKKSKRYVDKLLEHSFKQHSAAAKHSTNTRHRLTASGQVTQEVPRVRRLKVEKHVEVEPLLDAPEEEGAAGVDDDGMEDPANQEHDPEKLSEEHTQVSPSHSSMNDG